MTEEFQTPGLGKSWGGFELGVHALAYLRDGAELNLPEKDLQYLRFSKVEKGRARHVSAFTLSG